MMNLSTIAVLLALSAGPFCGDGTVDPGENCFTCPEDVQCDLCETCVAGVCVPSPLCPCGDGVPDPGETCENCAQDVPCGSNEVCKGGKCVPGCVSSTVLMDVVFVMDTSGSMGDEAEHLCAEISQVQSELEALGLSLTVTLLGIAGNPGGPFDCLTDNVNDLLGSNLQLEAWGPATAVVAAGFAWTTSSRVIVPISDEGPYNGDPCDDPGADRDAIENAIVVANENGVIVSPIAGTGIGGEECVATLGQDLAAGTGGTWHLSTDAGLAVAIFDLVTAAACTCTGDLNGDGVIGIADFLLLLGAWDTPGGDLDGDGDTGISDFLILLSLWGPCP